MPTTDSIEPLRLLIRARRSTPGSRDKSRLAHSTISTSSGWRSNGDFRIGLLRQYFYLFSSGVNVFYTILSYSLPNCDLQYKCGVQIHNTPNKYAWQYSNELVSSVVVVFQLHSACHESVGKPLSRFLQLFSSVVEIFFRCYFRITRHFMLRSQDELNTSLRPGTQQATSLMYTERALSGHTRKIFMLTNL